MAMGVREEMEKLSVEQLKAVKEQTDLEVNLLQDSLNNIRTATTRLELASSALHDLSLRPTGKKMLVPLTASLYVSGTLQDPDQVLVDVGTGYFIEKNMPQAKDYCDHKINLLKSNFEQLVEVKVLHFVNLFQYFLHLLGLVISLPSFLLIYET
ncbi:putative prefoldin [Rosa chinensis]|uniref:Putative prefoldin n=1 Tax=Rosa chinensis TaxID=74649 RepID=A0A2P6QQJ5_ROSCH|nr:putative prefoldin [Rosa chinensis]